MTKVNAKPVTNIALLCELFMALSLLLRQKMALPRRLNAAVNRAPSREADGNPKSDALGRSS